jgi:cysteine desulfurase / selenocysteine lyase
MQDIRSEFPIFHVHPELIYLDSASTLQKPRSVIEAVSSYLCNDNANIHRGTYDISQRSEVLYESARSTVAHFINARDSAEVVFTSSTTDGINTFVRSLIRS